jgi:protein-tyrosine-phosphatase
MTETCTDARLRRLEALADPVRLAVVDAVVLADQTPSDLADRIGVSANLLAYHLNVLESVGLVERVRSEGDRRRSYVRLVDESLEGLVPRPTPRGAHRVVFVCTHNSARSQLAEAVWRTRSRVPVASAGTRPAARVNPGAVAVARRHGLTLRSARPKSLQSVLRADDLVVSVCDSAHEQLESAGRDHLHWSVPDPVDGGTADSFESTYVTVANRVVRLAETLTREDPPHA